MKVFVGTSGWYYDWNQDLSLDWFIENSSLNAIELNASFYRFPFPNQIKSWAKKGSCLRWSIKVNNSITHKHRFNERAIGVWKSFQQRFASLEEFIDFYLFQVPPSFSDEKRLMQFIQNIGIGKKFALEIRNKKWLLDDNLCFRLQKKVVLVSVDSPDFQNKIFSNEVIYLRMHGKKEWYRHNYSTKELTEIVKKVRKINPKKTHIFFNNNHNMLINARLMLKLFEA
ncbi:DUF72 domain-containing protein [candidate division WOR-3 bacterium]|nr:DUF72 domain-containing protein [candidate division WOR-3 bacterium]